ncbi:dephospho-CoA kinase [Salipaludibacillus sp. CF4.18]|uniref:dephospho-CoA kinase n=1 Tax=Salipaludibacillus sp. CF4.18 TaxID=3373081 RepID=UPI003EE67145
MIIGLTGGIATGKSTVSNLFKKEGIPVIDADLVAREVVTPGKEAYEEIVLAFGQEILKEDKTIDRAKLGEIVFKNDDMRKKLNEIVHPSVRANMKDQAEQLERKGYPIIILDIPLLIESNLFYLTDKVVLVFVPEEIQRTRLEERNNYTEEEANHRIRSQIPITEKKKDDRISYIIDNSGSFSETELQVKKFLHKLQKGEG